MIRGIVIHRCRNCGKTKEQASVPSFDEAVRLLAKLLTNPGILRMDHGMAMYAVHACSDGSLGVTDIIAIEKGVLD